MWIPRLKPAVYHPVFRFIHREFLSGSACLLKRVEIFFNLDRSGSESSSVMSTTGLSSSTTYQKNKYGFDEKVGTVKKSGMENTKFTKKINMALMRR